MHIRERMKNVVSRIIGWWTSTSKVWRTLLMVLVVGTPCADSFFNLLDRMSKVEPKENASNRPQDKIPCDEEFEINTTNLFEIADATNNVASYINLDITNELHFAVRKMLESYRDKEYDDAVRFARISDAMLAKCDNHDLAVVTDHVAIKAVLMEEAFFNKDYAKVVSLHRELQTLGDNRYAATTPSCIALELVADLRAKGKRMFFFSPGELGNFRKMDKSQLRGVFSCLAQWGYIQPIMIDLRAKNHDFFYYEDFFGFENPLPYVTTFTMVAQTIDGHEIYSNEVSAQWQGRMKFEEVDIDKCVSQELNLDYSEAYIRGMTLSLEFKQDESTKIRSHYSFNKGFAINTNVQVVARHRNLWKPGITVANIKNPVFLTKSNERTITRIIYRIPPHIWFVIVILMLMAFSTPNNQRKQK